MGIKSALPKYEIYFYNTVLCLATLWAGSWVLVGAIGNARPKTASYGDPTAFGWAGGDGA